MGARDGPVRIDPRPGCRGFRVSCRPPFDGAGGGMGKGRLEAFSDGVIAIILTIPAAFWSPVLSGALVAAVAVLWFVPDRRIERRLAG